MLIVNTLTIFVKLHVVHFMMKGCKLSDLCTSLRKRLFLSWPKPQSWFDNYLKKFSEETGTLSFFEVFEDFCGLQIHFWKHFPQYTSILQTWPKKFDSNVCLSLDELTMLTDMFYLPTNLKNETFNSNFRHFLFVCTVTKSWKNTSFAIA